MELEPEKSWRHGLRIVVKSGSVTANQALTRKMTMRSIVSLCLFAIALPSFSVADELKEVTNSIGMKLVPLPAGKFHPTPHNKDELGPGGRKQAKSNTPKGKKKLGKADLAAEPNPNAVAPNQVPKVEIADGLYMGAFEITNEQYGRFREVIRSQVFRHEDNNKRLIRDEKECPTCPVVAVMWLEATWFCRYLSELPEEREAGRAYRLPSIVEWEYACRAGSTAKYHFGDSEEELSNYAWYSRNALNKVHPVGEKMPNAWGFYDMHGNATEWCHDLIKGMAAPEGITAEAFRAQIHREMDRQKAAGVKRPDPRPHRALCGGTYLDRAEKQTCSLYSAIAGENVTYLHAHGTYWQGSTYGSAGFRVIMTKQEAKSSQSTSQTSSGTGPKK